jgi:hypothetical protein
LCHAFLTEKESGDAIAGAHKDWPVPVAVEYIPGTGRPHVLDGSTHFCPVSFVECITRINQKETLLLFLGM